MIICAEIGQVPGSDLSLAIKLIQEAAHYGAQAVKVQALRPDKIATASAAAYWDGADVDQRTAFDRAGYLSVEDIRSLAVVAHSVGLLFVVTPFDLEEGLDSCVGADYIKIASGDIRYQELIEAAARINSKMIVSTGASTWPEARDVIAWTSQFRTGLTLLACTLDYPTSLVDANLGRVRTLQEMVSPRKDGRFVQVGYSDHTSNWRTAMACGVLGCAWLEVHFAGSLKESDRAQTVRDCDFALSDHGLGDYVYNADIGTKMRGDGRLLPMPQEMDARKGARRGLYTTRKLNRGEIIQSKDIAILRPGNGLEPNDVTDLIGRPAWRPFQEGEGLAD